MSAAGGAKVLEVEALEKRFGGLRAVNKVDFTVAAGEIVGLIGPNGAGKTTCFNVITGAFGASGGAVKLRGLAVTNRRPSEISNRGMVRTFQSTTLFRNETVWENTLRGSLVKRDGRLRSVWNLFTSSASSEEAQARVAEILEAVGLSGARDALAGSLPYGMQKRLGVAIALTAEPQILLLDEPAAGLNPEESVAMAQLIRSLRDERGVSVLLVEHDMKLIMGICDRIIVLEHGEQIAAGTPEEVRASPEVIKAYLGTEYVS